MTTAMVAKTITKQVLMYGAMLAAVLLLVSLLGGEAGAQNTQAAKDGLGLTGADTSTTANAEATLGDLIKDIIDILSIIVGAVSVIMIIIGGLKYITSAGDSNGVQSAKNTIIYAIVGLVIVIFAQTIVKFVIERIENAGAPADLDGDGTPDSEDDDIDGDGVNNDDDANPGDADVSRAPLFVIDYDS